MACRNGALKCAPSVQVHTILHSSPPQATTGAAGEPLDGHASGGSGPRHTPHSARSGDSYDEEIMETWLVLGALAGPVGLGLNPCCKPCFSSRGDSAGAWCLQSRPCIISWAAGLAARDCCADWQPDSNTLGICSCALHYFGR